MKEFTPYRICILGSHIDHQLGNTIGTTINRGITLYYKKNNILKIYSKYFNELFIMNHLSYNYENYGWKKYIIATVNVLKKYYDINTYIKGYIKHDLYIGGLSSSTIIIINYIKALCKVNNIKLSNNELEKLAYEVEHNELKINCGKLDQINCIYYKKNNFLYYDGLSNKIQYIKNENKFKILIIFSGKERELINTSYNDKVNQYKKLSLKISNNKFNKLRYIERDLNNYKNNKLILHYLIEQELVKQGLNNLNNINELGKLINLSCLNSIVNYKSGIEETIYLYNLIRKLDGVYGCKFCGAGYGGNLFAIIDDKHTKNIINKIKEEYSKKYPSLKNKFKIIKCDINN